ncbi:putative monovalent cation/H+ antiporter subunit A [Isoalcanivorax indicus]|uniref:putative monovalent cation/H+ antiporter subunit A n=1 Tax=Isoalcanivorax indicus TaxID=2202653 RepID=UPI000DB95EB9|nr:putative monovalent cation/H+ antiporter subunit A [Isoalcanivorax indicus]
MLLAVLSGFLVAALAPLVHRLQPRFGGWLLALLPAALFVWFASHLRAVGHDGEVLLHAWQWIPSLGVSLAFRLDGLSLLFALLISGIGFFIVAYAGRYLEGHRDQARLYVLLLCFMASMLGLVLSDNLISLFVFWELTSITSYLLVGFNHADKPARLSARQGLFVTMAGGLALMTGLVMLGMVGGSYELSELLTEREALTSHALYAPILLLIVIGAFTKSAQFPFHFWLPNAMAAPTPVSAYLHSATMVKAGVYLLARLQPALGGTELWTAVLGLAGAFTMFLGVFLAVRSTGIKRVLAYSTVMALGTLTMLIGIGTELALTAAMAFLLAHSLYKGALFLVAGIIDHETGSKDFLNTGGLRRAMPVTALFAGVAALSLGGIIPLFGFVAKELMFEAVLDAPLFSGILATLAIASAVMGVTVAAIVGLKPWYGQRVETKKSPHEAPPALLAGPVVLATLSLLLGLAAPLTQSWLLGAAVTAVNGAPAATSISLWHGINLPLMLSAASLALGLLLYAGWSLFRRGTGFVDLLAKVGPEQIYERSIDAITRLSAWQTRMLQNGYLRYYLMIILGSTVVLVGSQLFAFREHITLLFDFSDLRLYEIVVAGVLASAVLMAVLTSSRLSAVASLGAIGFTVALVYVLFSAPDLGITQVLIETLTVILLVLVLFRLPRFVKLSPTHLRLRDAGLAIAVGATMTLLMLSVNSTYYFPSISEYHIAESAPAAYGRNIVNVILVDFRTLDTLGEIFVLALAAIGVLAMIRFRAEDKDV